MNKINISSKSTIPANCAVTINAKLKEGAFKNAPMKKYPYIIKSDIVNATITEEKNYIINRDYIVEINENRDENNLINLSLWEKYSSDYMKNITIDNKKISFNSSNNSLVLPKEKGIYKFKVTYEVEPVLAGDVNFYINTPYDEGKTENLEVNITSPFNIDDYYVNFMEKGVNLGTKRYTSDINNNAEQSSTIPYAEIIDYLNERLGTKYRSTSKATQSLIRARFKDKFTVEDFKMVIDKKIFHWQGTKWSVYLRPKTLFGPNFESYLNEQVRGYDNAKLITTNGEYDSSGRKLL